MMKMMTEAQMFEYRYNKLRYVFSMLSDILSGISVNLRSHMEYGFVSPGRIESLSWEKSQLKIF